MTPPTDPDGVAPWYRRPRLVLVLAVVVLAAGVGLGLLLSSGDDGDTVVDTVGTTGAPTTTAPPTTVAPPPTTAAPPATTSPEDGCAAGDQLACDRLDDATLDDYCQDGNEDACQVLLARQGDGIPDGDEGGDDGDGGDPED